MRSDPIQILHPLHNLMHTPQQIKHIIPQALQISDQTAILAIWTNEEPRRLSTGAARSRTFFLSFFLLSNLLCSRAMPYVTHNLLSGQYRGRHPKRTLRIRSTYTTEAVQVPTPRPSVGAAWQLRPSPSVSGTLLNRTLNVQLSTRLVKIAV